MLRLAFDFIITWRETRTRPNAYSLPYGACLGQNETISVSHRYGFCKRNSMINRLSDFYANSSAR